MQYQNKTVLNCTEIVQHIHVFVVRKQDDKKIYVYVVLRATLKKCLVCFFLIFVRCFCFKRYLIYFHDRNEGSRVLIDFSNKRSDLANGVQNFFFLNSGLRHDRFLVAFLFLISSRPLRLGML